MSHAHEPITYELQDPEHSDPKISNVVFFSVVTLVLIYIIVLGVESLYGAVERAEVLDRVYSQPWNDYNLGREQQLTTLEQPAPIADGSARIRMPIQEAIARTATGYQRGQPPAIAIPPSPATQPATTQEAN